jgi:glutamyl-tRNA reductase
MHAGWTKRLALVATSFRHVGLGRLGSFVIDPEDLAGQQALKAALGAQELVYVATCNRVECYALLEREPRECDRGDLLGAAREVFAARSHEGDLGDALFAKLGVEAVEHLLTVTSSLDSLLLGETQISGQMKRAAERCLRAGLAGPMLTRVFDAAQVCSRKVRSETSLGSTPVSAASIAVQKIKKCFGKAGPGVSVLVGVGEMTRKAASALMDKPGEKIFVNRTESRAQELADRFGGRAMSLQAFLDQPPAWIDLVFTATASTETVIGAEVLAPALAARRAARVPAPLIVCDLGLPRDVDPALDEREGVMVVSMELVQVLAEANQGAMQGEAVKARHVVAGELARLVREDHFQHIAAQSAVGVLESQLAHLSAEDQEAIVRFAGGLALRLARQPRDLT